MGQGRRKFRDQVKRYRHIDLDAFAGGGASGGIGAVLIGLLGAKMVPGIELLLSYSTGEKERADCDLVIAGEGQSDAQTFMGKVPAGIAARAAAANCPIICVSGALGIGYEKLYELGFIGIFSIADRAMSFLQALEQAPAKLQGFIYSLMRTIVSLQRNSRSAGFTL